MVPRVIRPFGDFELLFLLKGEIELIGKESLKDYAHKLMFEMKDSEYDTLQSEFDVILKQMDLIGKIPNIKDVEPMTFPFERDNVLWREDVVRNTLTTEEGLSNSKQVDRDQVRVPKVVE